MPSTQVGSLVGELKSHKPLSTAKKKENTPSHHASKWLKDLNIRKDTIKLLEESIGKTFSDINHTNIFLGQSPKAIEIKTKIKKWGASLVAQWLRICLSMQGTWVQALTQQDPTCRRATKPMHHNYWARALEPASHNYWAHVPQLLKPAHLEPVLHNEKPRQWEARVRQRRVAPAHRN